MIPTLARGVIRSLERNSHKAVAKVQCMPADEPGHWIDLPVSAADVTINEIGVLPLQTVQITTTQQAARVAGVSVLGAWVRVWQDLEFYAPGLVERTTCPWGYYRVEAMTINDDGTVEIEAADAGIVPASDPALTLAQKSVPKGTSIIGRIQSLLNDCWPIGVYRWATLLDTNGVVDRPMAAVGTVIDEDRTVVLSTLARLLGAILVPVRDGTAIYRLVPNIDSESRSGIEISPGKGGNLVSRSVTLDRASLINKAHVVWQEEKSASEGGGVGIVQQHRVIVSYDDEDSPISVLGQFGVQSTEVSSNDITNITEAQAAARSAIRGTLVWNHDYPVDVSPVYGIESGDVVYTSKVGGYYVVGGSVDLMGEWSLTLRRADGTLVTGSPHYRQTPTRFEGTISDDAEWVEIRVPKNQIDLSFEHITGWTVSGGTHTVKDGVLTIRATGTRVTLRSADVIPVPALRRVAVEFAMGRSTSGSARRGYKASAAIRYAGKVYTDGQFPLDDEPVEGPTVCKKGEEIRASADQQLPVASDTTFAVSIAFTNLVAGQILKIENCTVERAQRRKVGT